MQTQSFDQWSAEVDREIVERTGLDRNLITAPYAELHHQGYTVMQAVAHALGYPALPRREKIHRMAVAMARRDSAIKGEPMPIIDRLAADSHYHVLAEAALDALGRFGGEF